MPQKYRRRQKRFSAAGLLLLLSLPFLSQCAARPTTSPPPAESPSVPQIERHRPARPCVYSNVERIVAVGDLHGAFRAFIDILRGTGLVDRELHWTGGRTHLVQMGDVMDRGPEAREILDLFRRLEPEAERAGGGVHMLLGNHEELCILGLSFEGKGYVVPEQFRAFLPPWLRNRKDAEFRAKADTPEEYNRLWEEYRDGNPYARSAYFNAFNSQYGRWLAAHPVVLVINDIVFVHGGLTEAMSVLPCDTINASTAAEFDRYLRKEEFEWVWLYQPRGPLWYRDLAMTDESVLAEEVDRVLANLKAKAIVIGHSPATGSRHSRFGEKVWLADTGIWMKEGGRRSALIIERGKFRMVTFNERGGEVRR